MVLLIATIALAVGGLVGYAIRDSSAKFDIDIMRTERNWAIDKTHELQHKLLEERKRFRIEGGLVWDMGYRVAAAGPIPGKGKESSGGENEFYMDVTDSYQISRFDGGVYLALNRNTGEGVGKYTTLEQAMQGCGKDNYGATV